MKPEQLQALLQEAESLLNGRDGLLHIKDNRIQWWTAFEPNFHGVAELYFAAGGVRDAYLNPAKRRIRRPGEMELREG